MLCLQLILGFWFCRKPCCPPSNLLYTSTSHRHSSPNPQLFYIFYVLPQIDWNTWPSWFIWSAKATNSNTEPPINSSPRQETIGPWRYPGNTSLIDPNFASGHLYYLMVCIFQRDWNICQSIGLGQLTHLGPCPPQWAARSDDSWHANNSLALKTLGKCYV